MIRLESLFQGGEGRDVNLAETHAKVTAGNGIKRRATASNTGVVHDDLRGAIIAYVLQNSRQPCHVRRRIATACLLILSSSGLPFRCITS